MSGEEFFSKVRCEQVAFVTQLGGAFGRLAPVDGNVVRYAVGGTRFRHHGGPQAGRAVKEPRRSRVPASPAPAPPRAPAADTYTDCTLP
jgi:hypothetical protein